MMKKYIYTGALGLATIFGLAACSNPKLEAKLSIDEVVHMSSSKLGLNDNQTLIEVSFQLENTSEDMETELKTSAKQFYLQNEDGKKIKASTTDKDDLPYLFRTNDKLEEASSDFDKIDAEDSKTFSLFFEVKNDENYKLYFKSADEKTEGQTVSTDLKNFDGQATSTVKKATDAYIQTVLLGGENADYDKTVANDLSKAKGEFSDYFANNLKYGYTNTSNVQPTGDEVPQVLGWIQTANRERGSYSIDNIIVTKDKAEFNIEMQTLSMIEADNSYGNSHPNITEDLQNYFQSHGGNASNIDQITKQYYMENYLPNAIKESTPVTPKSEGTNVFSGYSLELRKKDDKWAFPEKNTYDILTWGKWEHYPLFYAYTGQIGTLTY